MIDVLLVSPRLAVSDQQYSGEHAYTDTLLDYPPDGVRFHHYEDLLSDGRIRKIKWLYRLGPRLKGGGILPPDLWAEYLQSEFVPDVVHIHAFSAVVRFTSPNAQVPIVLSASTGGYSDLKFYEGWEASRIRRSRWLKRQYLKLIDAYDTSLRPEQAAQVLVWSRFSRQMHLEEGYVRPGQIEIVNPGLPLRAPPPNGSTPKMHTTFLFVGRDFVRKNGELVLDCFRRVHARHPSSRLILVGTPRDAKVIQESGVTHYLSVPRDQLLEVIYPQADVLVLPSKAEGFGLVLLEAMSFGMPVIGIDAWAMKEVVQDGVNGFLLSETAGSDLELAMSSLIENSILYADLKEGALRLFREKFAVSVHNQQLARIYQRTQVRNFIASEPSRVSALVK